MTMTAPYDQDDEKLVAMLAAGELAADQDERESNEALAAYRKVEALFRLLGGPAAPIQAHAEDELASGMALGEFAILRPLAAGGMGQVYLARQEPLGRLVALKVCKPEVAGDRRMKSRFMAEGRALARLTHPNVV